MPPQVIVTTGDITALRSDLPTVAARFPLLATLMRESGWVAMLDLSSPRACALAAEGASGTLKALTGSADLVARYAREHKEVY